jgi:hypothetical protein
MGKCKHFSVCAGTVRLCGQSAVLTHGGVCADRPTLDISHVLADRQFHFDTLPTSVIRLTVSHVYG